MSNHSRNTNNYNSSESNNWRKKPIDLEESQPSYQVDRSNYTLNNYNSYAYNYTGPNFYNPNTSYTSHQVQGTVYYQNNENYAEQPTTGYNNQHNQYLNNNRYHQQNDYSNNNSRYHQQNDYSNNNNRYHQQNDQSNNNNRYHHQNDRLNNSNRYHHQNNRSNNNNRYHQQNDRSNNGNWRSTASPKQNTYLHPDDVNNTKRPKFYTPYIDPLELEQGLTTGTYHQGIIRITKNRYDAYVTSDTLDSDIYIGGLKSRNRSLDGDLVVVKLIDVDPVWEIREQRRKDQKGQKNETVPDEEEEANADTFKPAYCGEVVGIAIRSPNMTFVGTLASTRSSHQQTNQVTSGRKPRIAWFKPFDKSVPMVILRDNDVPADLIENADLYKKTIYSVEITHWPIYDTSPAGKLLEELGSIGDINAEKQAILSEYGITTSSFSPVALIGLPNVPWSIPDSELKRRRDLRNELIFTIDPSTAKDLDDALHFKVLDDGFYEVGVHIADVSYFLKRGSALDEEALQRGTSTYLVDGVNTMLPSVLCEDLCSLNPDVDRLAFSVIWKMDAYGNTLSTWFGRTVIRSRAKLSYDHAQCVIDGDEIPVEATLHGNHSISQLSASIFMLNKLAGELRKKRFASGSLRLQSVKLKFELDSLGEPISATSIHTKEANHLVEEFMLCANISVANKILSVYPEEALLRRHDPPLPKRLNKFIDLTDELGFNFCGSSAGSLHASFESLEDEKVKQVFLVLAIRCMQRAKYFCAGSVDISRYAHYALNESVYTHFTSPIRRYADVMVHRLLEAALEERSFSGYSEKMMRKISFKCNAKKDNAKKAQDSSINLFLSKYLTRYEVVNGPVITKALVVSVTKNYCEFYVPDYGLEDKFYYKDIPINLFEYKDNSVSIYWKPNIPVPSFYERNNERTETDDEDDQEDEDNEQEFNDMMSALSMLDKDEINTITQIDKDIYKQEINIFTEINVRIQVNDARFPPIINIYPMNPFAE